LINLARIPTDGAALVGSLLPRRRFSVPAFRSWSAPCSRDGYAWYLRVMWMTARRWKRTEWAAQGTWRTMPVGPFVIAVTFEA
jgi:hypothetical protein